MFSIIIPCYNLDKYIAKTIESVLMQSYNKFELILVNDGSNDDTLSILNSYKKKDERIIVIDKNNGGVSSARNLGLKHANGEYIYFLDGDDYIELDLLERALDVFRSFPDVDMYSFAYDIVNEKGSLIKNNSFPKYDNKLLKPDLFLYFYFSKKIKQHISSTVYRKKLIFENHLYFSEDLAYGEDQKFQIMVAVHSEKIFYDACIYFHYLKRHTSAVNRGLTIKRLDLIKAFFSLERTLRDTCVNKKVIRSYYNYTAMVFFQLLRNGVQKKGTKEYFEKLNQYAGCLGKVSIGPSRYLIINFILAYTYLICLKFTGKKNTSVLT